MYSLIFFAPLLLQGGFGLTPQEAGWLVTPLAGCVAIGSILNSNVATAVSRPALILGTGYTLLTVFCLGMAFSNRFTPHWLMEIAMAAGGIGMGFIFNNLNIFSQELAGPGRFGITTALIQSTRMVGGMFGTALIGMLVTRTYVARVAAAVTGSFGTVSPQILHELRDPEVLMDHHSAVLSPQILEVGRDVLATSIHLGFFLTAIAAIIAIWQVRRIWHLTYTRKTEVERESVVTV